MPTNSTKENLFLFPKGNKTFIYSGYTGALISLKDNYQRTIKWIDNKNNVKMESSEIYQHLFSDDINAVSPQNYSEKPLLSDICIFITNKCNLNCSYCYEKENNVNQSKSMNNQTFKEAITFLLENFTYNGKIGITFFGGEPIINFNLIKFAISDLKYIQDKYNVEFTYCLTTNGTLLNQEINKFLMDNKFKLMVSIDGDRKTHDNQRKYVNGKGTYSTIIKNIKELKKETDILGRITLCDYSMDLIELYESLISQGFDSVFILPAANKNGTPQNLDDLADNLAKFSQYFLKEFKNNEIVKLLNIINGLLSISKGPNNNPRYYPCNAGNASYAVSVNGDIYLCHRLMNIEDYKWGNIYKGFNNNKRKQFLEKHHIFSRANSACKTCWARYLCGGTCYHASFSENDNTNSISQQLCFFNQELFKNSLYIYASLTEKERKRLEIDEGK